MGFPVTYAQKPHYFWAFSVHMYLRPQCIFGTITSIWTYLHWSSGSVFFPGEKSEHKNLSEELSAGMILAKTLKTITITSSIQLQLM